MTDCLGNGQLVGAILGSVIGTLLICIGIAAALFCFVVKRKSDASKSASPIRNKHGDLERNITLTESASTPASAPKKSMKDQVTMIDGFKVETKNFGTQKSLSAENINEVEAKVHLHSDDLNGLGFNIKGNMTDGIYVRSVVPKGPADLCGNILVDDRIRSLTIAFDGMVYEDAVTLLSYASPYQVKFVLERRLGDAVQTVDSESSLSPRVHPLFRSNTLTHCHFNPCSPSITPTPPPPEMPAKVLSPEPMGDRQDSPIITTPQTVSVKSESPVQEPPNTPEEPEPQTVKEEPKMISSDYSSDHSVKDDKTPSETSESMNESIEEKLEIVPPVSPQQAMISPPSPRESAEKLPPKKASRESGIPIKRTPTLKRDGTTTSLPRIAEVAVSKIPKKDSKTPIVERKLPPLPKSALQKIATPEKDSDIWSRLYQEKKGNLRKTRDIRSPEPEQTVNNNVMTTSSGSQYGTLNRERQSKLAQNEEILQRQQEELRQLGIL